MNRGREIEKSLVKLLKARPHANSGAMADKWDADTKDLLIEIKSTASNSYSIKRDFFEKLENDADFKDKYPVIILVWDDNNQKIPLKDMLIISKATDFFELLNYTSTKSYPEYGIIRVSSK